MQAADNVPDRQVSSPMTRTEQAERVAWRGREAPEDDARGAADPPHAKASFPHASTLAVFLSSSARDRIRHHCPLVRVLHGRELR
jgi:hypothetical protein